MVGAFIEHARLLVVYMYEQCTSFLSVSYTHIPTFSSSSLVIMSKCFQPEWEF